MDLVGDLGGVLEVFLVVFGLILYPVSEHSYVLSALNKLFLVRTSSPSLFKKTKKGKKHVVPVKFKNSVMEQEVEMHYIISLSFFKSCNLFFLNRCCMCSKKNNKLVKLFSKG